MIDNRFLMILLFTIIIIGLIIFIIINIKVNNECFQPINNTNDYNNGVYIPNVKVNKIENIFDLIYPLNSLYVTTNKDIDPNTLGEDIWEKIDGFIMPFVIQNTDLLAAINSKTTETTQPKHTMIVINDYDETIKKISPTNNQTVLKTIISDLQLAKNGNSNYKLYKIYIWKKTKINSNKKTESFTRSDNNNMYQDTMITNKITNFGLLYPVGSLYYTSDETFDPNSSFGGKWILYNDNITPYSAEGLLIPIYTSTYSYDTNNNKMVGGFVTNSKEFGNNLINEQKKIIPNETFNNYILCIWQRIE